MRDDRTRWERRYTDRGRHASDPPSQFLQRQLHHVAGGPVLDIASGDGRNALYVARAGFVVEAIDIAFAGLQQLAASARAEHLPVRVVQADLDDFPLPRERYGGVVNIRYLQRSLFEPIKRALRPGGVLIIETFLIDQRFVGHPTNPDHLLEHGELVERLRDWEILCAEEGRFDGESGSVFLARAVARRPVATKRD